MMIGRGGHSMTWKNVMVLSNGLARVGAVRLPGSGCTSFPKTMVRGSNDMARRRSFSHWKSLLLYLFPGLFTLQFISPLGKWCCAASTKPEYIGSKLIIVLTDLGFFNYLRVSGITPSRSSSPRGFRHQWRGRVVALWPWTNLVRNHFSSRIANSVPGCSIYVKRERWQYVCCRKRKFGWNGGRKSSYSWSTL